MLLIIIMAIVGLSSSAANNVAPIKVLAARLIGTEKIVGNARVVLNSSKLRALNSSLGSYLANANHDIIKPLALQSIDVTKLDKKLIATEANPAMVKRLEDDRLNGVYDREYAREMASQLETIGILMRQVYGSTTSKSLKTFLEEANLSLAPTQQQFAKFDSTNG